ncbi:NAD(P)-binding protein [Auricularia subglabra TFB-10046 SS5]|nr:NAD(P)-binding protein [Auricularia subglabra TFB-10046 SS5]
MPVVTPPEKVLVTGASGFIGAWVAHTFLEHGFAGRGTVRSHSKGAYLQKMFDASHPGLFEYAIVRDISAPGAFDEAVRGVYGIAHTASPVAHAEDPQDLIRPAVQGTLEILRSARLCGDGMIKRIVVTASMASVMEPHPAPYIYSEKDWNETSVKEVETKGKDAADIDKYRASKMLAEKAL